MTNSQYKLYIHTKMIGVLLNGVISLIYMYSVWIYLHACMYVFVHACMPVCMYNHILLVCTLISVHLCIWTYI